MDRICTDFLAPSGTAIIGAGSIFNIGGTYFVYNRSGTPQAADVRAIRQDFAMIGQDIARVIVQQPKKANARS